MRWIGSVVLAVMLCGGNVPGDASAQTVVLINAAEYPAFKERPDIKTIPLQAVISSRAPWSAERISVVIDPLTTSADLKRIFRAVVQSQEEGQTMTIVKKEAGEKADGDARLDDLLAVLRAMPEEYIREIGMPGRKLILKLSDLSEQ